MKTRKVRQSNTGFKGISKHKASNKFEVRVNVRDNSHTHNYYVGLATTIGEAVKMRNNFITNLL